MSHSAALTHNFFGIITGESFEHGIKNSIVLQSDEAVVITAEKEFDDVLSDGRCLCVCVCVCVKLSNERQRG